MDTIELLEFLDSLQFQSRRSCLEQRWSTHCFQLVRRVCDPKVRAWFSMKLGAARAMVVRYRPTDLAAIWSCISTSGCDRIDGQTTMKPVVRPFHQDYWNLSICSVLSRLMPARI